MLAAPPGAFVQMRIAAVSVADLMTYCKHTDAGPFPAFYVFMIIRNEDKQL
jgi:hypothetical protein